MKFIIPIIILFTLYSCNNENDTQANTQIIRSIGVEDFDELRNDKDYILIDIRNPEELEMTGYIEGAINMPYYYPGFMNEIQNLDKEKKYLIYCNSGNRTGHTLRIMQAMGFKEAHHLDGGIQDWLASRKNVTFCDRSGIC